MVLCVRPLSILFATLRSGLSRNERIFLALTAPRGIVAAAVASVFSLRLADVGVENSQILVSVTFTVIAGTVALSGLGGRFLASRLDLVRRRDAIVILGANTFCRTFAATLEQHGAPVRLIDLDRRELAHARLTGLSTHRGSVLDDSTWHAAGISTASSFLAMTGSDELNTLAARRAATDLGRQNVFSSRRRRANTKANA